jgi:hypothetical protein
MKNIAIIELTRSGHHETYMHLYSRLFLCAGCRVTAFYPDPEPVRRWVKAHCNEFSDNFDSCEIQHPALPRFRLRLVSPLLMALRRWAMVVKTISSYSRQHTVHFDFVFFNYLDYFLLPFPLSSIALHGFPCDWGGIFLQPGRLYRANPGNRKLRSGLDLFSVLRSNQCRIVGSLQEDAGKEFGFRLPSEKLKTMPDITDTSLPEQLSDSAISIKSMAHGRRVIGFFGKFRPEKDPISFITMALSRNADRYFFLMFGEVSEENFSSPDISRIRAFVSSPPAHCYVCAERFEDEAQFNELVNLCDVVFAAFVNYPYSSNTLTKAAFFRKLLIVSRGFCMEERVNRFRLGISVGQKNPAEVMTALDYIVNQYESLIRQADFDGYYREHSEAKVIALLKLTKVL